MFTYQVYLDQERDAVQRMLGVQKVFREITGLFGWNPHLVIEGANYGARYGQVELAEVRAAIVLLCIGSSIPVKIVPPRSIRKVSFGSAKIVQPFSNLPDDAVAAIGCAYYLAKC